MGVPLLDLGIDDAPSGGDVHELGGGDLPGCIKLWRSVIATAVADALASTPSRDRDRARRWLTEPSEDHSLACDCAALDPGLTLHRARELAERGWKPLLRGG
jgi:hypothetical protein